MTDRYPSVSWARYNRDTPTLRALGRKGGLKTAEKKRKEKRIQHARRMAECEERDEQANLHICPLPD